MSARKVSAQFAAYIGLTSLNGEAMTTEEARRFARQNWVAFLPSADEGLWAGSSSASPAAGEPRTAS
jgi:hypothetical protein